MHFHSLCVQTVKALARQCGCVGSLELLLVAYVISTIISSAGSFDIVYIQLYMAAISPIHRQTCRGTTISYQ